MTLLAISIPGERTIFDGELMPESMRPGIEFAERDGHDQLVAEVEDEEVADAVVSRYDSIHEVQPVETESGEPDEDVPAIPEDLEALDYRGTDDDSGMNLQDLAQAHDINASQSRVDLESALAGVRDGGSE